MLFIFAMLLYNGVKSSVSPKQNHLGDKSMNFISLLTAIIWLSSFLLMIYVLYYGIIALFSIKRLHPAPITKPTKRFAVLIPARNEARVIGNLIQTLKWQDYPSELYKIIVLVNHCTDDTRMIALANGATVMDCTDTVNSKGQVLSYALDQIAKKGESYDACCIFDADNLVDPHFLMEMNNALCSGTEVAQGYRDSKNPGDSIVSAWHSLYYYSINRLYNQARGALGLSAIVNGTGFMFSMAALNKLGGWHTVTLTEDLEFSALCALNHIRIHWVPKAHFYDEQPIAFKQSWNQRMRWSKGAMQCFSVYAAKLLKHAIKMRSLRSFDMLLLFLAPVIQIISFSSMVATLALTAVRINYQLFPQTDLFFKIFISLDGSYLIPTAIAFLVVVVEKKNLRALMKGILTSWFFIMSWVPINIICLFRKTVPWHPIVHTRNITLNELRLDVKQKA
jgi:cellulose synthase/poly-beta-1,6-N-acetylglucosamine synthase-like glycosyltransferase